RTSANIYRQIGNLDVAGRYYPESIRMYEALIDRAPHEPLYQDMLAEALRDSSSLLERSGKYREAAEALRRAMTLAASLAAESPGKPAYRRTRASSLLNLAGIEYTLGQYAESERTAKTA